MTPFRLPLLVALVAALAVPASPALSDPPASRAPRVTAAARDYVPAPRPRAEGQGMRCTADRAVCISLTSYIPDVCRTIEAAAQANDLDPNFFVRLVWKESLFDAGAVSPAGAQGIAQFMPDTARLRGLADPFNPAEALRASARYLSDLSRAYGNIGLAAVAYNGGEARAERFIAGQGGLPLETRAYVAAITGHTAQTWRDAPPPPPDLALAPDKSFQDACVAHAATRKLREFPTEDPLRAWGVIVASNASRDGAERQVARLKNRHAAVLQPERIAYARARLPGMPRRLHTAQVGRDTRAEADGLCQRLKAAGGACIVLKN